VKFWDCDYQVRSPRKRSHRGRFHSAYPRTPWWYVGRCELFFRPRQGFLSFARVRRALLTIILRLTEFLCAMCTGRSTQQWQGKKSRIRRRKCPASTQPPTVSCFFRVIVFIACTTRGKVTLHKVTESMSPLMPAHALTVTLCICPGECTKALRTARPER